MKKLIYLIVLAVFTGIVGCCDCDHGKKCDKPHEKGKCGKSADKDGLEASMDVKFDTIPGTLKYKQVGISSFGDLSSGLDESGSNICVQYDGFKVYFQVLTVKDSVVSATNAIALEENKGFEVGLADNGSGGYELIVTPNVAQYPYNVNLKGKNIKKLSLGGSDPKLFDVKVSKSCPALGAQSPPAIVGSNDARDGIASAASAVIGSLAHGETVRIHAEALDDGYDVVFSIDSAAVSKYASLKFAKMGIPNWGCDFDESH